MNRALVVRGSLTDENRYGVASGARVADALRRQGWRITVAHAGERRRIISLLGSSPPDVVVPIGFGPPCEDGHIFAVSRMFGVPCAGPTPGAGSIMQDKAALGLVVKGLFSQASLVRAPTSVALNKTLPIDEMERSVDSLRTPLVVKPAFGGSSEGLVVADTHAIAIRAATAQLPKEGKVLVQELEDSESEISCTVLDDLEGPLFLPIVELVRGSAKVMGIEEKFGSTATGRHVVPARLTPELHDRVRHAVLRLHDAIGAVGLTRTDIIITKRGEVVILEINGIPGLLETSIACDASLAAGISFDELCVRYASTAFLDRPEPRVWGI